MTKIKDKTTPSNVDEHLHGEIAELHEENTDLRAINSQQQNEINALKKYVAELENEHIAAKLENVDLKHQLIGKGVLLDSEKLNEIYNALDEVRNSMIDAEMTDLMLNTRDRMRLAGAGERRYGFIHKVHNVSQGENSIYFPALADHDTFNLILTEVEQLRNIVNMAEWIRRLAMDHYLVLCDAAYAIARLYYRAVQDAARTGDAKAQAIFNDLRTYYARFGRRNHDEPTDAEILTDVRGILHGRKVGKVAVARVADKVIKGGKKVIDDSRPAVVERVIEDSVGGM